MTCVACSWAKNCAANNQTNGVDNKGGSHAGALSALDGSLKSQKLAKANVVDLQAVSVGLPSPFQPTVPSVSGSEGVIKSYILSDKKTGVVRMITSPNI